MQSKSNYSTSAPVCLFCFNRPDELSRTLDALSNNFKAPFTELFIFSDGPRDPSDFENVAKVRRLINKEILDFAKVEVIEYEKNKGLANSVISGVSQVISKFGKVIVLEDDLVTSPNFLDFMNQALDFYEKNKRIFSISGYTMDLPGLNGLCKDYYLGYRGSSWGWATWQHQWEQVDWDLKGFNGLSFREKLKFRKGGSDLPRMLKNHLDHRIDSWAIRWVYHQYKINGLTIFPKKSKIISIGYGETATHTKKTKRFITELDPGTQRLFNFYDDLVINAQLVREFRRKFSFFSRLKDRF